MIKPAKGVLFVCKMNSIRSPLAEAIASSILPVGLHVDSAGIYEGLDDPFVPAILAEIDIDLGDYTPKEMAGLDLEKFDLIVAMTPEAETEARSLAGKIPVILWSVPNPSDEIGRRDQMMSAYRQARDAIMARIKAELL